MSNVLITGGLGEKGSKVVNKLLKIKEIDKIYVYDNMSSGKIENIDEALDDERITIIRRDIQDHLTLDYVVYDCDYIFHFAEANEEICNKSKEVGFMTNIIGTFNILRSAVNHKIKKFAFFYPKDILKNNFYVASKISGGEMIKSFCGGQKQEKGMDYVFIHDVDLVNNDLLNYILDI